MGRGPAFACVALLTSLAAACGDDVYPGRADVREGDPAEFRIETASAETTVPAELTAPAGTDVRWVNRTTSLAAVRFQDPIAALCGEPDRFERTRDGDTYATPFLAPFEDARLCVALPGRYRFLVDLGGVRSAEAPPALYGTLVVVPRAEPAIR